MYLMYVCINKIKHISSNIYLGHQLLITCSQVSQIHAFTLAPLDWQADIACQTHYIQVPSPHQGEISPEGKTKTANYKYILRTEFSFSNQTYKQ